MSECVSLVWLENNTFISSECTPKFRNEVLKLILQEKDEGFFLCLWGEVCFYAPREISMSLLINVVEHGNERNV